MATTEFVVSTLVVAVIASIITIVIYNIAIVKNSSQIPDGLDDDDSEEVADYDDLKIIDKD